MGSGNDFFERVEAEAKWAESQHGPVHSYHELYAFLNEELEELWVEIKKKPCYDREAIMREAVQIAALCWRCTWEDLRG